MSKRTRYFEGNGNKARADQLVKLFQKVGYPKDDLIRPVVDILADVRHLCQWYRLDFTACNSEAEKQFLVDKAEEKEIVKRYAEGQGE